MLVLFLVFLRNLHTIFRSGCINLHSHQQWRVFPFLQPSPAFIICRLLDSSHPDWRVMVPHCGFDLHFSNNERYWASFHVFVICMSSLEKCLFRTFSQFLTGLFVFLVLSCMNCLCILKMNPVSCFVCYYFLPFWKAPAFKVLIDMDLLVQLLALWLFFISFSFFCFLWFIHFQ